MCSRIRKLHIALQNEDVAEAMEGLEELGDIGNQSVREIAKLTDSDQVSVMSFLFFYF